MTNINIPSATGNRIVIVGGGFAGIELARSLGGKKLQVVLLDKNNYHTFQPLLYQVATGGLEPDSIAYPLRRIVKNSRNLYFRMTEVKNIDSEGRKVLTTIGDLSYDFLVIALGSQPNFFNFEPVKMMMMPLKSVTEALDIRSFILQNFEAALLAGTSEGQEELMNIVIVGGGPTGVELAGALAEMKKYILPSDYPELDFNKMNIHLFEMAPRLLGEMSENASLKSLEYLKKMGVIVHLNSGVKDYDGHIAKYGDEHEIKSETLIWTAGVKGGTVAGLDKATIVSGGRIKVNEYLEVDGHKDIYAIGDIAALQSSEYPNGHPMLAQVAIQQGRLLAKNIIRENEGKTRVPFVYNDKGSMATVGRNKAVVDLPGWKFQGAFAWFVWMFVHLFSLIGFRNRFATFMDWVWNYITYDRAFRLIIRPYKNNNRNKGK